MSSSYRGGALYLMMPANDHRTTKETIMARSCAHKANRWLLQAKIELRRSKRSVVFVDTWKRQALISFSFYRLFTELDRL